MERIKPSLKDQQILFAEHYIGDRLPKDHEVYVFDALLETMDLSEILKSYGSEGGQVFSPRDMIAVLLYAYSKGITSSYKISAEIRANLAFIYLAGGQVMHRRTLCDFRKRNATGLAKLFSSTVQKADAEGLLHPDGIFALDGSKISADASKAKTRTKAEWQARREKIQKNVADYFDTLEKSDAAEEGMEEEQARSREDMLRRLKQLKEEKHGNKAAIREVNNIQRQINEGSRIDTVLESNPHLQADERINLTEPESRLMKNGTGEYLQGFNAQIVTSNQIICAADLSQSENDQLSAVRANSPAGPVEANGSSAGKGTAVAIADQIRH